MFRTARYWIQFWASWNHSPSSHHISLIYTLILGYLPPITWASKNIVSFCVSLIKFYTYFCLSMRATTSIVDLILLDNRWLSKLSSWTAFPFKTKELRSFETLGATHPTQPRISGDLNHNLHFATDFTDRVYWGCWRFVQPWPHPKSKWGFQRNPTIGTWQVTQSTQIWKQIKNTALGPHYSLSRKGAKSCQQLIKDVPAAGRGTPVIM